MPGFRFGVMSKLTVAGLLELVEAAETYSQLGGVTPGAYPMTTPAPLKVTATLCRGGVLPLNERKSRLAGDALIVLCELPCWPPLLLLPLPPPPPPPPQPATLAHAATAAIQTLM